MAKKKTVLVGVKLTTNKTAKSTQGAASGTISLSAIAKKAAAKKKKAAPKKKATPKKKASPKKKTPAFFGKFGTLITFSVSDKKIMTFETLKREGEGRWKEHDLIGSKPRKQFLGPGADTVTLSVTLDARHGVKPRKTLDNIIKWRNAGRAEYLIVKGQKVCANKMVITKTSDTWGEVWNRGELVRATVDLTFEEYI